MENRIFEHLNEALPCLAQLGTGDLCVATPYLTSAGLSTFMDAFGEEVIAGSRWLTSLTLENALSTATEPVAVISLLRLGASVRSLDSLHAKLYLLPVANSQILGSANLTGGGLHRNHEIVLWNTDRQLTSKATELFDEWWARGRDVTSAEAHDLKREAERAEGLQESTTALMRLMALGAFVSITVSTPDVRQEHTISLEDVGVPTPDPGDISPEPPTLSLWPSVLRQQIRWTRDRCRKWIEKNTAQYQGRFFLQREKFQDLDEMIGREERLLWESLNEVTEEQWQEHRESLEEQVAQWLYQVANDQRREPEWADDKIDSIMKELPIVRAITDGFRVTRTLEIPHPDSGIDLSALLEVISARLPVLQRKLPEIS